MVKYNEKGAALLSVLLLVTLISIVALSMVEVTLRSLKRAQTVDRSSRVSWQVTSATELGLSEAARLSVATDRQLTKQTEGLGQDLTVPLGSSLLQGRITEASNCFNVNSFFIPDSGTEPDVTALLAYRSLLEIVGFNEAEREALIDPLLDWFDPDSNARPAGAEDAYYTQLRPAYQTSSGRMVNITELRAVAGYTPEILEILKPFVCARPSEQIALLNLNTLEPEQAALLAIVLVSALDMQDTEEILGQRPSEGWQDMEEFAALEKVAEVPDAQRLLTLASLQSTYLMLTARVTNADVSQDFRTLYMLEGGAGAALISHMSGREQ